jgi:uncharacterized protein YpmB
MSSKPLVPTKQTGDFFTAQELNAIVEKFADKPDKSEVPSLTEHAANNAKVGITPQQAAAIVANTAKKGISPEQEAAIVANTAKVGITPQQAAAITANTAKVGITPAQASAITANTAKKGITPEQEAAIEANTAKVGITTAQANAIVANTAKKGITPEQEAAIVANSAKEGITAAQKNAIAANTAKVGITQAQADAIVANTAKVGITPAQASAIAANSAKVGITTAQANAIIANTAKVGITPEQAAAILLNSAKVGITPQQAADISETKTRVAGLPLMNSDQFAENIAGQIVMYKYLIPLASTTKGIAFNFNYRIGSLHDSNRMGNSDPANKLYLSINDDSQQFNKCIVFSQSSVIPDVLDDERVELEGDEYSTANNDVNILTFEYIAHDYVICRNKVRTLSSTVPSISKFYSFTRNSTNVAIDFSDCPVGELMIVAMANLVGTTGTGYNFTAPAGWDSIIEMPNGLDIWVRKKQAGDASIQPFGVVTATESGGIIAMSVSGTGYVNGNTSSIGKSDTVNGTNSSPKIIPALALTQPSLCLAFFGIASNNAPFVSFDESWTLVASNSRSNNRPIALGMKIASDSTGTATATQGTGQNGAGIIIALKS